jgi:hypothetical protein
VWRDQPRYSRRIAANMQQGPLPPAVVTVCRVCHRLRLTECTIVSLFHVPVAVSEIFQDTGREVTDLRHWRWTLSPQRPSNLAPARGAARGCPFAPVSRLPLVQLRWAKANATNAGITASMNGSFRCRRTSDAGQSLHTPLNSNSPIETTGGFDSGVITRHIAPNSEQPLIAAASGNSIAIAL